MKLFKVISFFIHSMLFLLVGSASAIPPTFSLAENSVSLVENALNTIRYTVNLTDIIDAGGGVSTFSVTTTGNIFTTNPAPLASFATTSIITTKILSSTASTATLYFTIIPDTTGAGSLTIVLTDSNNETSNVVIDVVVTPADNIPVITSEFDSRIENITVYGGHLYAQSVLGQSDGSNGLTYADNSINNALGGYLFVPNSIEEQNALYNSAFAISSDGDEAWIGANANNNGSSHTYTMQFNDTSPPSIFANVTAATVFDLYPGFFSIGFDGDQPNAGSGFAGSNSGILVVNGGEHFLVNPTAFRRQFYEFPGGFSAASTVAGNNIPQGATGTIATLSGFDLDDNNISWSIVSYTGNATTVTFSSQTPNAATGTTDIYYTPDINFSDSAQVVVSLSANSQTTYATINFSVTANPAALVTGSTVTGTTNTTIIAGNATSFTITVLDNYVSQSTATITTSNSTLGANITITNNGTNTPVIDYEANTVGTDEIGIYANGVLIASRTITVNHGTLVSVVLSPINLVVLAVTPTDATLTATLRDSNNNLITTASSITFGTNDGGVTITITSSDTITANGLATLVVTSKQGVVGKVIITATATISGVSRSGSTTITTQAFGFTSVDDLFLVVGGSVATTLTINSGSANTNITITSGVGSLSTNIGQTTIYTTTVAGTALITATGTINGNIVSDSIVITTILLSAPSIADISEKSYEVGTSIIPLVFTNTATSPATPSACTTSPSLPAGLSVAVSGNNCAISGTPSAMSPASVYTITTSNASGSDSATVTISAIIIDTSIDYARTSQGASVTANRVPIDDDGTGSNIGVSCYTTNVGVVIDGDTTNISCFNSNETVIFTIDLGQDRMISAVSFYNSNTAPNVTVELQNSLKVSIETKTVPNNTYVVIDNSASNVRYLVFTVTPNSIGGPSVYGLLEFIARPAVTTFSLDVDDNGTTDVKDGLLILRFLAGASNANLSANLITGNSRNATDIKAYLIQYIARLDVDGNGIADAATDGFLIIRYLVGVHDTELINEIIGSGSPTRTTATAIRTYLDQF